MQKFHDLFGHKGSEYLLSEGSVHAKGTYRGLPAIVERR